MICSLVRLLKQPKDEEDGARDPFSAHCVTPLMLLLLRNAELTQRTHEMKCVRRARSGVLCGVDGEDVIISVAYASGCNNATATAAAAAAVRMRLIGVFCTFFARLLSSAAL